MTCDYQCRQFPYQHCGNDEAYSEDIFCESGEHHLIVYKCKLHKDRKISFDRMLEIIKDNEELYGVNAYDKLKCTCVIELENTTKVEGVIKN